MAGDVGDHEWLTKVDGARGQDSELGAHVPTIVFLSTRAVANMQDWGFVNRNA